MKLRPFLSLLRYTDGNTLDLANDQLNYYYGYDGDVCPTMHIVQR